jgi:hypothetical protein
MDSADHVLIGGSKSILVQIPRFSTSVMVTSGIVDHFLRMLRQEL